MKPLITGLVHITGDVDSGKSRFALECGADPKDMLFVDDDLKGRATVRQLKDELGLEFGRYIDLVSQTKGMKELALHDYCQKLINDIRPGQFQAIIWDTWTRFEDTCQVVVEKDQKRFRDVYSPMGAIKGSQIWAAAFDYEASILDHLLQLADIVVLTSHLKPYNLAGKRIDGKWTPAIKKPIIEKCVFRIWLRRNPNSGVPFGIVLKRLNKNKMTENGLRTINVLPSKIMPRQEDQSLWDTIRWYFENPFGNRTPNEAETPTEYELSIIDGHLTSDQKVALQVALMSPSEEESIITPSGSIELPTPTEMTEELKQRIVTMSQGGLKAADIKKTLLEDNIIVPLSDVMKILK